MQANRFPPLDDAARAGQLLIIGIDGTRLDDELARRLKGVAPGGIILFARNLVDAPQVAAFCRDLARLLPVTPFLAIDQEGGRVNRLKGIFPSIPANLALARASAGESLVREHGDRTGRGLHLLGFNLNFAPVLDLSEAEDPNGIGDRAYGTDPGEVVRLARTFLSAQSHWGVLGCGKHFPGLGGGRVDSHLALPIIDRPAEDLWRQDLLPYRELREECPMVMVGHAGYPSLQGPHAGPATLSRAIVQDLLRDRIRYRGVILTDDLEMGAVDQTRPPGEVVLEALEAGNDMVMYCKAWDRIEAAHAGLARAIRTGRVAPARLDASLARILSLKEQLPRPEALPPFADSPFAETIADLGSLESRLRA